MLIMISIEILYCIIVLAKVLVRIVEVDQGAGSLWHLYGSRGLVQKMLLLLRHSYRHRRHPASLSAV